MRIESSFTVDAAPHEVFAYMLDVNQVVGCVPGAELVELVDSQTFKGKLKVKVGAVQVAYSGTARLLDVVEDEQQATVTVGGEGREIGGQGSVRATLVITVRHSESGGSLVRFDTDFTVTGRIAQFGRGIIEDVSRRLVTQTGACIDERLRAAAAGAGAEG